MKKTVFVLTVLLFLAGCAETGEQKSTGKMGPQGYIALPVELHVRSDEGLPVEVRLKGEERVPVELQVQDDKAIPVQVQVRGKEGIPVKVQWPEGEGKPVKVELHGDKALPVKVEMPSDRALPVEMKITRKTLMLSMIPIGVSLVAAIGACAAAVAARWSARKVQLAAEGRLFFEQMDEYASKEMRDDVRMLWKWKKEKVDENKSDIAIEAKKWAEELFDEGNKDIQKKADDIDLARRHVQFYFSTVLRLNKSRYARKYFLKEVCEATGTEVLDIILPLSKALNEFLDRDRKYYKRLEKEFERLKNFAK